MRANPHIQPQVSDSLDFLATHIYEGLALDLYGTFDDDGYEVNDVALAGTNIALHELVSVEFLERLTTWCNDKLPSAEEINREAANEARIDSRFVHGEIFGRRRYP